MTTASEIRAIFGRNLRKLVEQKGTISSVSSELGINRTQLNRYLNSEAFPRPDTLTLICDFFNVDARILNEELPEKNDHVRLVSGQSLPNPPENILPSGIYIEWSKWSPIKDKVFMHFLQISRPNGACRTRIFARPPEFYVESNTLRFTARNRDRLLECRGFAFIQGQSIATVDGLVNGEIIALTTYQVGHLGDTSLFLGYKLAGTNYQRGSIHSRSCCVLQRVPQDLATIVQFGRKPHVYNDADVPINISTAFMRIQADLD